MVAYSQFSMVTTPRFIGCKNWRISILHSVFIMFAKCRSLYGWWTGNHNTNDFKNPSIIFWTVSLVKLNSTVLDFQRYISFKIRRLKLSVDPSVICLLDNRWKWYLGVKKATLIYFSDFYFYFFDLWYILYININKISMYI